MKNLTPSQLDQGLKDAEKAHHARERAARPQTNAELVYGDEDAAMEGAREVLSEERWRTGGGW